MRGVSLLSVGLVGVAAVVLEEELPQQGPSLGAATGAVPVAILHGITASASFEDHEVAVLKKRLNV